jgi:hypothetical protein
MPSTVSAPDRFSIRQRRTTMYDMYPEWGPARQRPESNGHAYSALQTALDLRDNGGERPDDN